MPSSVGRYKYQDITDRLRAAINHGNYPTGVLPRETDLVEHFGVSRVTVNRAVRRLADEGIVRRVKGQGTFINGVDGGLTLMNEVGLVMRSSGHFYDALYNAVRRELLARDSFPVTLGLCPWNDEDPNAMAAWNNSVRALMESPVRAVIIEGSGYSHRRLAEQYPHKPLNFIYCYDAPGPVPAPAVLADFRAATRLATRHLIEQGHRRIALYTLDPFDTPNDDPSHVANSPIQQLRQGYLDAMRNHGLYADILIADEETSGQSPDAADRLRGYLARPNRPTAMVCTLDCLAVAVVMRAIELGLAIPNDLAVTGLYDTPWATLSPVQLTSVSLGEEEMGRRAVDVTWGVPYPDQPILVKPRLVVRQSSVSTYSAIHTP